MVYQFLLYNKVNQLYIYIYIYPHISSPLRLPPTLPIPLLQVVTKHPADLPVLCGCFPLAIQFTFGSVYISPCHSLISSQLTLPPPHGEVFKIYKILPFQQVKIQTKYASKMYYIQIMSAAGELGKTDNKKSKNNSTKITGFYYFQAYMYMYKHIHLFYNSQILLYIPL